LGPKKGIAGPAPAGAGDCRFHSAFPSIDELGVKVKRGDVEVAEELFTCPWTIGEGTPVLPLLLPPIPGGFLWIEAFSLAGELGADGLLPVVEDDESGGLLPIVLCPLPDAIRSSSMAVVDIVDPVSLRSGSGSFILFFPPVVPPVPVTKDMPLIPASRLRVSMNALSFEPCRPL
jgi:hypothetical protein